MSFVFTYLILIGAWRVGPVTEDGKVVGAYGWREDQSCWARSIYLDTWHPALTSVTTPDLSVMIDGHIYDYPEDATVLLRRTRNGEPALVTWKVGEGQVIASSFFTDFQGSVTDRRIVRDLITWAKNPNLPIPEYNLRKNANPEVSLNFELKNITNSPASKAKILWLDPDRSVLFEEEKLVSIPPGGNLIYSTSHTFSNINYNKLGIGHVDYILYDSEGVEIQSQAVTATLAGTVEASLCLPIPGNLTAGSYEVKTTPVLPSGGGVSSQSRFTVEPEPWLVSPVLIIEKNVDINYDIPLASGRRLGKGV